MEQDRLNLLKNEAYIWNLASDNNLLNLLRNFSVSLSDKTKNLVSNIDSVTNDALDSETRLRNTLNEFLFLSNNQFIENVSEKKWIDYEL